MATRKMGAAIGCVPETVSERRACLPPLLHGAAPSHDIMSTRAMVIMSAISGGAAVILHGTWVPGASRFYLWAEQTPAAGKGRASKAARRPHPFAAPVDALREAAGQELKSAVLVLALPS